MTFLSLLFGRLFSCPGPLNPPKGDLDSKLEFGICLLEFVYWNLPSAFLNKNLNFWPGATS